MARRRQNPETWKPPEDKPESKCTVPELWGRYHQAIAKFRDYDCPLDTVEDYTGAIAPIKQALSKKPAAEMSAFDIWDAIVSVRFQANGKPYSISVFNKRMTVIKGIFSYAEAMSICCNPLWLAPWDMLEKVNYGLDVDEIKNALVEKIKKSGKVLPRYLTRSQERKLMKMIAEHITEDGRWVGLLILLWCGVRPSEVRGLRYEKLIPFRDHPERRYLQLYELLEKARMKNKQSVRDVAEHIEMLLLMIERESFIRSTLGTDEIGHLPIVCVGNDFERACTSVELAAFVKEQLAKIFAAQELEEQTLTLFLEEPEESEANNLSDKSADMELAPRMFRRNFSTKSYAETRLEDTQERKAMGHKTECDMTWPYSEEQLWQRLQAADHRMVLPEYHPGWNTVLGFGHHKIADAGIHFLRIPAKAVEHGAVIGGIITANELGDAILLEFKNKLPPGSEIEVAPVYLPGTSRPKERLNTDFAHWPLPKWPKFGDEEVAQEENTHRKSCAEQVEKEGNINVQADDCAKDLGLGMSPDSVAD